VAADKEKGKSNVVLVALIVFNILAMLALGGLVYYIHTKESKKMTVQDVVRGVEEEGSEGADALVEEDMGNIEAPMYELDAFTVNLADTKATRYARVSMKLELSNEDVVDEIEQRTPQIRDLIIILISSKRFADVQNSEGKNKLRDEIIKSINSYLIKGEVKNLYYTNFVVN
jgi:flagellar FliL protein